MANRKYTAPTFRLAFGAPVSSTGINTSGFIDTSPDAQTIQITSKAPGGFDSCSLGFEGARIGGGKGLYLGDIDYLNGLWDLTVTPGVALFGKDGPVTFNGRVLRIDRTGNWPAGCTASGYGFTGLNDYVNIAGSGPGGTSGTVLTGILNAGGVVRAAPPAYFIDPGVAHGNADYKYYSTSQIIDQIEKEGGFQGTQAGGSALWDHFVYEAQLLQFVPRVPPVNTIFKVPNDSRVRWTDDYTDAVSHVYVRFTPPAVGGAATPTPIVIGPVVSPTFLSKFGITRQILIEGGTLASSAAATQFANTYLALHQDSYVTCTISRDAGDGLDSAIGGALPPYLIRAGQWVQVGENAPLICTQTTYDGVKGTLQVTLNSQPLDLLSRIRDLIRLSRYAVKQTVFPTGARASFISGP